MFAASKTRNKAAASSGDPYWTSVSLLTNFENNLTFQDGSTNNFAITRTGVVNPSLNTPFSGVGGSEWFNGASDLSAGSNAAFAFGTGAYTVECWVYLTVAVSVSHNPCFVFCDTVGGFGFYNFSGGGQLQITTRGIATVLGSSTTLTANVWNHIVAVRSGTGTNLTSIFVNGTRVANGTDASNWTVTGPMRLGSINIATYNLNGFMSNVRVVKGTAVYDPTLTTLTVPTAPLTAITNTSLLITGTGQGMFDNSTFVDQGPNALTVTATGAPVYSGLSPFGNTYAGSVLLNGSTQYLSGTTSTASEFGTGDFTVESWVYLTSATTYALLFGTSGLNMYFGIAVYGVAPLYRLTAYDGTTILEQTAGTSFTLNAWNHVAWVRSGTTFTAYLNGASVYSTTNSKNITGTTGFQVGHSPNYVPYYFAGNISNFRVVKGAAVYTANFTPSTTPLTAITNTSLLVRGDTGAFYDLSNSGNSMTSTGTTAVTTQVKKYGAESASYTATAYQTVADAVNLQLGTGDYTIEAWVYRNAAGVLHSLICKGAAATGWLLQINTSNQLVFTVTSTAILTSTTTIAATTWTFVTVTRSGTSTRLFVGGNLEATATDSTNFNQTNALFVGSDRSNANGLNGYLDDIRITKGVARYTATFTPPTATFPTGP